jgi:hypothetical protein
MNITHVTGECDRTRARCTHDTRFRRCHVTHIPEELNRERAKECADTANVFSQARAAESVVDVGACATHRTCDYGRTEKSMAAFRLTWALPPDPRVVSRKNGLSGEMMISTASDVGSNSANTSASQWDFTGESSEPRESSDATTRTWWWFQIVRGGIERQRRCGGVNHNNKL